MPIALLDNKGDRFWDSWMKRSDRHFGYLGVKGRSLSSFTLECEFCKLLPVVIYLDNAPHYRAMISILSALPSTEE